MTTTILEKPEIEGKHFIIIDDLKIKLLPDCPKCHRNVWHVTQDGIYLVCSCGAKFYNRGRA
jgi:hypothetical protein